MSTEKILLRIDTEKKNQLEISTNNALNAANALIEHCKIIDLDVPFEWIKKFVVSEMKEEFIDAFIDTLFPDLTGKLRRIQQQEVKEDLITFSIGRVDRTFNYIEYNKGYARLKKDALEQIKELCSVYLTDPEEIKRYKRLEAWIKEGNSIWHELKPFNPLYHYTLTLPNKDGGYTLNNHGLNFS